MWSENLSKRKTVLKNVQKHFIVRSFNSHQRARGFDPTLYCHFPFSHIYLYHLYIYHLRSFNVSKDILTAVLRSVIESVLSHNISSWYTFLSVKDKSKLSRIIKHASEITGTTQSSLSDLHTQAVRRKATSSYMTLHMHSTTHSNSFLQVIATGSH